MSHKTEIVIEAGSTNVYTDLGYADAAEMQRKSQLAAEIARGIKARRLTQQGAAELLGVDQSKVSRITRGQFRGVSEAKLLELVTKLGHDVKIVVGPVRRRAGKIGPVQWSSASDEALRLTGIGGASEMAEDMLPTAPTRRPSRH